MKRMIIMVTSGGKGETEYAAAMFRPPGLVAYTRVQHDAPPDDATASRVNHYRQPTAAESAEPIPDVTPATALHAAPVFYPNALLGPLDFSRHLNAAHPNLNVAITLKEFMARQLQNVTTLRNTQITDMVAFTDKLAAKLATKCACCSARGFPTCILNEPTEGEAGRTKIQGRRLDLDAEEGGSSVARPDRGKRAAHPDETSGRTSKHKPTTPAGNTDQLNYSANKSVQFTPTPYNINMRDAISTSSHKTSGDIQAPKKCPMQEMFARAVDMAEAIRAVYSSHNSSPGIVIFGDCLNQNHEKVEFTPDITWAEQWFPRPGKFFKLGTKGYSTLVAHVTRVSAGAAARPWIEHGSPRYINIPGIIIRKQLVGAHPVDPELCSAIIRRMNQILKDEAMKLHVQPTTCALEPDFAIAALAGMLCPALAHIRNQFVTEGFHVGSCSLFHAPTPLHDGWFNIAFEMPTKTMYIMDPTASPRGLNPKRKKKLVVAADKLLEVLFDCINTFFTAWPVVQTGWTKRFPILVDTNYTKDESGLCTTYFVKNFCVANPDIGLSRDNLNNHKRMLLHQIMKMRGNSSLAPKEQLVASKVDDIGLL